MRDVASWYPVIKSAHLALVVSSGVLFASRGALLLAGQGWAMARPWRMLSYAIDSLLLMAGVSLWALLSLNPLSSPWLGVKLLLLPVYIVLGSLALKRAPTPAARLGSYVLALAVYLLMASVAQAHHPLGFFQRWGLHGG